jgi:threonine/homoserine/homoserine lactone efflux protein
MLAAGAGRRPTAARWVSRVSGAAMIIIGAVLIGEQVLGYAIGSTTG